MDGVPLEGFHQSRCLRVVDGGLGLLTNIPILLAVYVCRSSRHNCHWWTCILCIPLSCLDLFLHLTRPLLLLLRRHLNRRCRGVVFGGLLLALDGALSLAMRGGGPKR